MKLSKYEIILEECKNKISKQIIEEFNLTEGEIYVMKELYRKQYEKEKIIEDLYNDRMYELYNSKANFSKNTFGLLKKKNLIYSVSDLLGWIGTDIKV